MKIIQNNTPLFVLMFLSISMATSCIKDGPEPFNALEQFNKELGLIDAYLEENSIEADIDSITDYKSQIRYVINEPGTGDNPVDADSINIDYTGSFLSSGNVFDDGEGAKFKLSRLIPAWRIIVPLIKEGGSVTMYAPSYYCYGPYGQGSIPGNATLVFEVKLNSIIE